MLRSVKLAKCNRQRYSTIGLKIRAQATCNFDAVNTLTLATARAECIPPPTQCPPPPHSSCGEGIHRIRTTGRLGPYLKTNSTCPLTAVGATGAAPPPPPGAPPLGDRRGRAAAEQDWTGLLVEAENWSYRQLLLTHRKARTLNACLAPAAHPQQLGFEGMPGSPLSYVEPGSAEAQLDRQRRPRRCFPLYSVLLAAGLTTVDLLALDVEGIEYLVLHSLPWHLVDIK
ncbi:Protein Star [Amphibalanus amphitrite]|uniref:Protein Star n=1 Tax=Amphibalanus amphitrite TaxID=1232801 RepID=A0A6A4VHF6_AMPAM|nr:Protein Star [Amphibalanus amphitrite]